VYIHPYRFCNCPAGFIREHRQFISRTTVLWLLQPALPPTVGEGTAGDRRAASAVVAAFAGRTRRVPHPSIVPMPSSWVSTVLYLHADRPASGGRPGNACHSFIRPVLHAHTARLHMYGGTITSAAGRSAENLGRWPGDFVSRCCKNRATPETTCSTLSHRCSRFCCLRLVLVARSIGVCTRVADDAVRAIPMNLSRPLVAHALPLGRVSADGV
jgi:hypothetical protein